MFNLTAMMLALAISSINDAGQIPSEKGNNTAENQVIQSRIDVFCGVFLQGISPKSKSKEKKEPAPKRSMELIEKLLTSYSPLKNSLNQTLAKMESNPGDFIAERLMLEFETEQRKYCEDDQLNEIYDSDESHNMEYSVCRELEKVLGPYLLCQYRVTWGYGFHCKPDFKMYMVAFNRYLKRATIDYLALSAGYSDNQDFNSLEATVFGWTRYFIDNPVTSLQILERAKLEYQSVMYQYLSGQVQCGDCPGRPKIWDPVFVASYHKYVGAFGKTKYGAPVIELLNYLKMNNLKTGKWVDEFLDKQRNELGQ